MNETLDHTAAKILETQGTLPIGVFVLLLLAIAAGLAFALYKQHQWGREAAKPPPSYDDSRVVDGLAEVRECLSQMHTELAVGFKSLEKVLDTFIRLQK